MHPKEFWWLAAHYQKQYADANKTYAGMSEEEVEMIYRETYGETPFAD